MTLGSGNDRIDLHYFGRGHTNGDAWVVFPVLRVMHAGDIFSGKNLPLLDYNNGGSGAEIPETLMKAYNTASKSVDSIITGHSTVMTPNDLREYLGVQSRFSQRGARGQKAGKSAAEIAKTWTMPEKSRGYGAPQPARVQSNVENIYNEARWSCAPKSASSRFHERDRESLGVSRRRGNPRHPPARSPRRWHAREQRLVRPR